jgi:hypothetical protein
MTRPVVGLLVRPGVPAEMVTLLTRLQRWAEVRSASTDGPTPSAYVATSPEARGIDQATGGERPLAVWVDTADETEAALGHAGPATMLLTGQPAVARILGPETVVVPSDDDGTDLVPRSPFVRRRWRQRVGFPTDWTVTVGEGRQLPADDPLVPTALTLAAAAVVVDASAARQGLATGCPMVVDAPTAEALGVVDGVHAIVLDLPSALAGDAVLRTLVDDDELASKLSRSGRELFDRQHDATAAVRRVAAHLGLLPDDEGDRPLDRLDAVLDALHTPDHTRARHRVHELLAGLPNQAGTPA